MKEITILKTAPLVITKDKSFRINRTPQAGDILCVPEDAVLVDLSDKKDE